jgi:alpha-tubulin suppressor-like RCC1 family protein
MTATEVAVKTDTDLTVTVTGTGNFDPAVRWEIVSTPQRGSLSSASGATVKYTAPSSGLGAVVQIRASSVQDPSVQKRIYIGVNSGRASVSSGYGNHTLAIRSDGKGIAWGSDSNGQLGNGGGNTDATSPEQILILPTTYQAVAVGESHSLSLNAGKVYAWGSHSVGQLGTGGGGDQNVPTVAQVLPADVIAIAAGANHSLAVRQGGTVFSWGSNSAGQLGNATNLPSRNTPTFIPSLADIVAVAAGEEFSLALKSDGKVFSWGSDAQGQLGNGGNNTNMEVPVLVPGATSIIAIAAGRSHALALKSDGTLLAWGLDANGELGDNAAEANQGSPVPVANASQIVAISAGGFHSMALKSDRTALVWGSHLSGQLGTGTNGNQTQTTPVATTSGDWVGIATGRRHSFGLKSDGSLVSFGSDSNGQLGNGGANTTRYTPDNVLLGAFAIRIP